MLSVKLRFLNVTPNHYNPDLEPLQEVMRWWREGDPTWPHRQPSVAGCLHLIIAGCLENKCILQWRRLQPPANNILVGFIIGRAMAGWLLAATAAVSVRPDGIKTRVQLPRRRSEKRGNTT